MAKIGFSVLLFATCLSIIADAENFSQQSIQLAWFYKPPKNTTVSTLARHFDDFILSKGDESTVEALRRKGVQDTILQYFLLDAIEDPGSCSSEPNRNQVAYERGDFCMINSQHPDWFLKDSNGKRLKIDDEGQKKYLMDPSNSEWRRFWLDRAKKAQKDSKWDGVFLDSVDASLLDLHKRGLNPAKYPSDKKYITAISGFLTFLYQSYFQPQQRPLFANISALKSNAVWFRYLKQLDGAMVEAFAVDWHYGYRKPTQWLSNITRAEKTQALGKHIILVSQGQQDDQNRQQFAFASYLLVASPLASFRYSKQNHYNYFWPYKDYNYNLGDPVRPRYDKNGVWRRDFTNGYVTVDPAKHQSTIHLY